MDYTTTTINKNKALAWLSLFTEKAIDDGNIDVRPMVSDKGFLTIISIDKIDIFVFEFLNDMKIGLLSRVHARMS